MPTRSLVLAARSITEPVTAVLVTCPAGFTLLVKDIRLVNWGSGPTGFQLFINRVSPPASVLYVDQELEPSVPQAVECWTAMEPGDYLAAFASAAGRVDVWVSGTALPGVQVLPPAAVALPVPRPPN